MKKIVLIAFITLVNNAYSTTVSVGAGANCTYSNIYAALDSIDRGGSIEIELNQQSLEQYILPATLTIIDRNVTIRGGYNGCGGLRVSAAKSILDLDGVNGSVIRVTSFATPTPAIVNFENILVSGGQATKGGGIKISGDNDVRLISSLILSNNAVYGGGIYIDGTKGAKLRILSSKIEANSSFNHGGGVYCLNSSITLATVDIDNNISRVHGGGIFLDNCDLYNLDTGAININDNSTDIIFGQGSVHPYEIIKEIPGWSRSGGGGIYAYNGSNITIGGLNSPINILRNIAHGVRINNEYYGFGGGIRIGGIGNSTSVNLINSHIDGNVASLGAGVFIRELDGNSEFSITGVDSICSQNELSQCSSLKNNHSKGGDDGGFGCLVDGSNWAGQGAAIWVKGASNVMLNGAYVNNNKISRTDGCVSEDSHQEPEGAAFYIGTDASLELNNSILANSSKSIDGSNNDAEVVRVYGKFTAVHSTITKNNDGFNAIIRAASDDAKINLVNSILFDTQDLYDTSIYLAEIRSECSVVSSISELTNPNGPSFISSDTVETSNVGFVNTGADDFHLQNDSIAIDLCNSDGIESRGLSGMLINDFEGGNRPIIGSNVNAAHSFDAGAYENQVGTSLLEIDLSVNISDGDFNYGLNQQFGYTVQLENNSAVFVNGVGVKIELDPQITLPGTVIASGAYWDCTQSNYTIVCDTLQTIAANSTYPSSIILAFSGFSDPTVVTSTAESLPGNYYIDSNDSNNLDTEISSIAVNSDVGVDVVNIPNKVSPASSAEFTFAFENYGTDNSINAIFSIKLDHVDADLSMSSVPDFWNCFIYQDPNDSLKPRVDCNYPNYFPVSRQEFTILAVPPSGTPSPDETFNIILNASTASNDENMENNWLTVEVPLVAASDTIFKNSFEN